MGQDDALRRARRTARVHDDGRVHGARRCRVCGHERDKAQNSIRDYSINKKVKTVYRRVSGKLLIRISILSFSNVCQHQLPSMSIDYRCEDRKKNLAS